MTTYCTADDVRAQAAPRVLPQDDDELDAVILLAERDVDRKFPDRPRGDGSLKMDIDGLDGDQTRCLMEGAAHQTLYRLHMGYQFFIESHQQVGGKDYSSNGAPPKFSPAALAVLQSCGLIPVTGRSGYGRGLRIRSTGERTWTW